MKVLKKNKGSVVLQCSKPEDYESMLDVLPVDWFMKLKPSQMRHVLTNLKKGQFAIDKKTAKQKGLFFEKSKVEFIPNDVDNQIMELINVVGPRCNMDLCKQLAKATSTIGHRLKRLTENKYIEGDRYVENGHWSIKYSLTEKGAEYYNELSSNR